MRALIYAVFCCLLVLGANSAAAQTGPDYACTASKKFAFKDLVQFAREYGVAPRAEGKPENLPKYFAELLGFGNSDMPVIRFSEAIPAEDTFRAIDLVRGSMDYLLFKRVKGEIHFWKISEAGKTIRTLLSVKGSAARIVPNAELAGELTELCGYFFPGM